MIIIKLILQVQSLLQKQLTLASNPKETWYHFRIPINQYKDSGSDQYLDHPL